MIRTHKGLLPQIGKRVFIAETAVIIGDVAIGDDCSIWYGTVVRGDIFHIRIGDRTNIQDNCTLHVTADLWPVLIEEEVTLGHGVIAHGCTIGRGALIGMGARLLDGSVIGEHAVIAAGSIVTEGMVIPPKTLAMGAPARVKRELTAEELAALPQYFQHYMKYKEAYLSDEVAEGRKSE